MEKCCLCQYAWVFRIQVGHVVVFTTGTQYTKKNLELQARQIFENKGFLI